jgi:hypothetical protein
MVAWRRGWRRDTDLLKHLTVSVVWKEQFSSGFWPLILRAKEARHCKGILVLSKEKRVGMAVVPMSKVYRFSVLWW